MHMGHVITAMHSIKAYGHHRPGPPGPRARPWARGARRMWRHAPTLSLPPSLLSLGPRHPAFRADRGEVDSETHVRLCGENLEHVYFAVKLTAKGCTPRRVAFGPTPNSLVVCTTTSTVNTYSTLPPARRLDVFGRTLRRSKVVCTANAAVLAVFGDPATPEIEVHWPHGR